MWVVSNFSKLFSKMKVTTPWLEAMIMSQTHAYLLGGWTRLYIKYYYKKNHEWIEGDMNMATQTWDHGPQDKTKSCIHNKMVNILNE
jgi:hypothetical protein